jgi:hypothetical protein
MFDRQLWLGRLDLVALLANAFIGHVVALLLLLFARFAIGDLQVAGNECRGEFVLGDCGGQQLGDTAGEEVLLEDLAHAWSSCGVLDEHVSEQVLEVL